MDYMPRTRNVLTFMGFAPSERTHTIYLLSHIIQQIMLFYMIIGAVTYTIQIINEPKIKTLTKIETTLMLLISATLIYGYLSVYYIKIDVKIIFDKIKSLNEFGHLEKAKRKQELTDYLSVFMIWFCGFGAVVICTIPLLGIKNCKNINLKLDTLVLCGFALGMKYPYEISSGLFYYFHWMLYFLEAILICTEGTIFLGTGFSFYMAVVWRCEDLCEQLRKFNTYDDFHDRKKCLHHSINYHIRIIELADYINGCFSWVLFPCIVSHNIVIGIGCMGMMTGNSISSILPTITWIAALFVCCYMGEKVMDASTEIAVVAYKLDWYKDPKLRRDIAMMILRAQRPIKMKCGNVGQLSMIAFKNIMHTHHRISIRTILPCKRENIKITRYYELYQNIKISK